MGLNGPVKESRAVLPWIVAFEAMKTLTLTAPGIALLVNRYNDAVDG